jgi:hypothetical protein
VRAAIENGGLGFSFLYFERQPLCPQTSVPELPVWSANLAGSDFGAVYAVWVYPDEAAAREEWDVSGERPRLLFEGCQLPTEYVYWNANVVMAFEVWSGLDEEYTVEEHGESPDEHPAVLAFVNDLGREPVVLTVEPESGTCSEELTLSGSGLPPGAEVEIVVGESGSNNGVSKGTVVADDQGRFELLTTPSPPLIPQCGSAGVLEFRVFAEGFSGWGSAEYEYEPQ